MSPQILLSVIIPTHHRAHLLARCLSSIKEQAGTMAVEVLVISDVIDPATDMTCAQWLAPQDVYMRRNGPPGPSASRNLGLKLAQGRYVMFLDDDDSLEPGYFAQLQPRTELLAHLPVYTDGKVVTESRTANGPVLLDEQPMDLSEQLNVMVYIKNQVPFSCFLFPRLLLEDLSFDTHMRAYEDWEFVLSFLQRAVPVHLALIGPRIHVVKDDTTDRRGSSAAANDSRAVLDYLYVYHRHPAPSPEIRQKRQQMMQAFSIPLPPEVY
jgi:GalNAc5-diNAcBac-PP-undecaprenol beta-1,3-glucosyltransferase